MWQEAGFLLIYIVMGVFVLLPQYEILCLATTLALQFLLAFILGTAFMIAFFASSLVKGSSIKNGRLPLGVNFIWPVILGVIPAVVSYFALGKDQFNTTDVHCFAPIYSNLFWTFAVPAWVLWFCVLVRNQLSVTACRQTKPTVDRSVYSWGW